MKYALGDVLVAGFLVLLVGCSATDSLDGGNTGTPLERGATLFSSPHATGTDSTAAASCAQCHGVDGSGDRAASIRGIGATTLQAHAQGDAFHPALSGGREGRVPEIKFPELDAADFELIAAFLASN